MGITHTEELLHARHHGWHCWTEEWAAQEEEERRRALEGKGETGAAPRTVFLCFWDSVSPTATCMEVREESAAITGRTPLAADAAFAGWHDARTLPGGFVDGEVAMVVPAADSADPPWPALVVDADAGHVPANVLALRDRAHRRALVQYFGDSTYGWVAARQLERVDALSSATRRAVRTAGVHTKAWVRAFEEMQRALGHGGSTDVHAALESMLRDTPQKERAHKRDSPERAPRTAKQVQPVPDERKRAKRQEADPAPPKSRERPAQSTPAKKPLATAAATKTSSRPVATKPGKQGVAPKAKACAPQSKFMIVSSMEKHRGFAARKRDDDSSSSEDEKTEEVPKKKAFVATCHAPHTDPILCFSHSLPSCSPCLKQTHGSALVGRD